MRKLSVVMCLFCLPLLLQAADLPDVVNTSGAFDQQMCVNQVINDCVNTICENSPDIHCTDQCQVSAQAKCQEMSEE
jgi:hypothetical protein